MEKLRMPQAEQLFGQKTFCIVNPSAARSKWKRRSKLRNYLQKNLPGEIVDIQGDKELTVELARKVCPGRQTIVVVGGDGTVADAIQGIIASGQAKEVRLAIIPLGSGNAFRKSLGIPKNVKKALRILAEGKTREIDLIEVEGRLAGFASVGATACVTQEKLRHNVQSLAGHLLASRILFTLPKKEVEIELFDGKSDVECFDQKTLKPRLFDCVVGKTNYFGYGWKVAPKAKLDDGYLDITLLEMSGPKYVLFFPLIYYGLFQRRQKHFKVKKMVIRGKDLALQYNGEFLGVKNEFEFRVLPRALKVVCPPEK
jgi:diacylglycerol kinase family enzyme